MKRKLPLKPSFHWQRVENNPYCKIFSVKLDWCGKILKITFKQVGLTLAIIFSEKTRLQIIQGPRVNGESMFPRLSNGDSLGEL